MFLCAGQWQWESIDASVRLPLSPHTVSTLVSRHDLCVTGEGLTRLTYDPRLLDALLPHVRVFARVSPKQKVSFKSKYWCLFGHINSYVTGMLGTKSMMLCSASTNKNTDAVIFHCLNMNLLKSPHLQLHAL